MNERDTVGLVDRDDEAHTGLTILRYTAEPGSKSEEALSLLASWTAMLDEAEPSNVTHR